MCDCRQPPAGLLSSAVLQQLLGHETACSVRVRHVLVQGAGARQDRQCWPLRVAAEAGRSPLFAGPPAADPLALAQTPTQPRHPIIAKHHEHTQQTDRQPETRTWAGLVVAPARPCSTSGSVSPSPSPSPSPAPSQLAPGSTLRICPVKVPASPPQPRLLGSLRKQFV